MWLLSPKAEAHMQLHIGHGLPAARKGADVALCMWSSAAVRAVVVVLFKVGSYLSYQGSPVRYSEAEDSNCLGSISAHLM